MMERMNSKSPLQRNVVSTRKLVVGCLLPVLLFGSVVVWLSLHFQRAVTMPVSRLPASTREARHEGYVGSQACAICHASQVNQHARSGHAQTFYRTDDGQFDAQVDGRQFKDPERGVTFHYHAGPGGLSVSLPERFPEDAFPLHFGLGSGQHAITFMTLVPGTDGRAVGIEHRVSLFGEDHELDLTPSHRGQAVTQEVEHFGRVRSPELLDRCLNCHTTTYRREGVKLTELQPHVGCESCHGPARRHVEQMQQGTIDDTLGLTAISWTATEQIQRCGECHRRPDMLESPLQPDNLKLVRYAPVGILQTACYRKSEGRLSCTTCHDPHRPVSRDAQHYETRCLSCHSAEPAQQVSCKVSSQKGCIACHMPQVEVHPGMSMSDHWIRVRGADGLMSKER
jgi:hypothetical protein